MTEATKATPGYLFQLTCDCGNGKNLVVSFNPPQAADRAALIEQVDMIQSIFDRERAKHEAPLLAERIEGTKQEIERLETELQVYLDSHLEGKMGPKGRDETLVNKLRLQISHAKIALARGEITYAETLEKAK